MHNNEAQGLSKYVMENQDTLGFRIPRYGFQVLDSGFVSRIVNSKVQDS